MFTRNRFLSLFVLASLFFSGSALADYWEASVGFNYTKSTYNGGSYSWNRRYGGSLGYNFSDSSTIEFAYQKSYEMDRYPGFEDSTYNDEVYSVNWVQNLLPKTSPFQPYFKIGIGQLIREASVYDSLGRSQVEDLNQITGVLGAGFKFFMTKQLAVRIEGVTYLPKGEIRTWKDNFNFTFGVSLYF